MSFPTSVNDQITDTVSQSALMTSGTAPSTAQDLLNQGMVHALGTLFEGACAQQQATQILADAALSKALSFFPLKMPGAPDGDQNAKNVES